MEQRVNLKFLVKLEKTFTEVYAMLNGVYGNECLFRTQVFEWFKEGRETTEHDPRPGRPSTSKTDENIEKIGQIGAEEGKIRKCETGESKNDGGSEPADRSGLPALLSTVEKSYGAV
ncbi:hypothetical protein NQ318_010049 [Aromia moschata]|uniref:Mos1 transposase HTH domain-containing protein n=1 Tax=Aromia moschata TaxID=1265417 RepID=A0AAV8X3V9_9CUCU|nr:hypothetical protein NQ318_010049 [Aromia moschata]